LPEGSSKCDRNPRIDCIIAACIELGKHFPGVENEQKKEWNDAIEYCPHYIFFAPLRLCGKRTFWNEFNIYFAFSKQISGFYLK
jgi:hypothetical protein